MTPESPGRYPPDRGRSESSGARRPDIDDPMQEVLVQLRAMRKENAELEGRVSAVVVGAEKRLQNVANGNARADVEATRFDMGREIGKLRKQLTAAALAASIAVAGLITRWAVGSDVAQASEAIAETAVDVKAAEITKHVDETRAELVSSTKRIDVLEAKIDRILVALDDLAAPAPEPEKPKPKKGSR